jgi:sugar transferase (PEP-CTERM/EpsH1 system associated)
MRELLFLSHRIPYPPDKGDKIRSFHILQHLSRRFRIHLGCFSDDVSGPADVEQLRNTCAEVFCLPLSPIQKVARGALAFFKGVSISELSYHDPRMKEWVDQRFLHGGIDDVFVFCSAMYPYIQRHARRGRIVLDMVDVDSQKWGDYARSAGWPLNAIYRREQRKLFALERLAANSCDCALFVSSAEANLFRLLAPESSKSIQFMDNGVDLVRFDCASVFPNPFPPGSLPVVFTGMMDYRPNIDAVSWFARDAMTTIRRAHGAAEFWVVGKNPSSSVRALQRVPGVRIVGSVPDVRPYLAHASCVVAPLRIARGVQNKVLEAMAMGKIVVLTPAALEGLRVIPNQEVLLASGASELARVVSRVLAGDLEELGRAARLRVESDYQWPNSLGLLDRIFEPSQLATPVISVPS